MLNVLLACEFSGIVREEFTKLGHNAWSCDLEDTEIPGNHYKGDIFDVLYGGQSWDLMIAFPPCTYLTVTGNKWFKPEYADRFPTRQRDREDAIKFFMQLANAPINKIAIENPVGIMSTVWRKPDQIINPWEYGHKEPKKTCLWLKNLPLLEPTNIVTPEYHTTKSGKRVPSWYYKPSNTPERQKMRNRTFKGIAAAMASQYTNFINNENRYK